MNTDLYINFVYHTVVIFVMETLVNRPYEPVHAPGNQYHNLTCVAMGGSCKNTALGPFLEGPRNLFGPVKPFLVHLDLNLRGVCA